MKILIAGVGDLLRRDDGFGPNVVKRLKSEASPDNIVIEDYGTSSYDLIFDLEDFDEIIFVDAMNHDGEVGEVRLIEPKARKMGEEEVINSISMSLHETELQLVIDLAYSLNILPKKVSIIGCKPKDLGLGLGLSEEVETAVEDAVRIIIKKVYGRLK